MSMRYVYRASADVASIGIGNGKRIAGAALFRGEPDIKLRDASTRPRKYVKRAPIAPWEGITTKRDSDGLLHFGKRKPVVKRRQAVK